MKNFTPTSQNGWKLSKNEWITESAEETISLGMQIGRSLKPNSLLCFFGDLGAGKTTLIKGIVSAVTGLKVEEVNSPTFVYEMTYKGSHPLAVHHFDLYRLKNVEEFIFLGFEEFLSSGDICCIEWSEKILPLLQRPRQTLTLSHLQEGRRHIRYEEITL